MSRGRVAPEVQFPSRVRDVKKGRKVSRRRMDDVNRWIFDARSVVERK
jgi:hypothetical protein